MSKRWILDTETKGTGAQMVPVGQEPEADGRSPIVVGAPEPRRVEPAEPRKPRRFKVVDVMTRRVLAEDVGTRDAVKALERLRSVVDANVYVWQERAAVWEQLSQGDRGRLWDLRGRVGS